MAAVADQGLVVIYSGDGCQRSVLGGRGDEAGDRLGGCVADLGDVDGDGVADFAASAALGDDDLPDAGMVRVYSGAAGAELYTLYGEAQR